MVNKESENFLIEELNLLEAFFIFGELKYENYFEKIEIPVYLFLFALVESNSNLDGWIGIYWVEQINKTYLPVTFLTVQKSKAHIVITNM